MIVYCPKCKSSSLKKVKYTWWGGIIIPAIINITKCEQCGKTFNGNTGKSNAAAIVFLIIVLSAIVFAVSYYIEMLFIQ